MTWFKSLTTFKKILLIIGVVIGLNFLWSFVSDLMFDAHVDGISQEFVPMSEALDAGMASKNDYDLEETIRIIHAIEHARDSSNNFQELMAFMAMQDYSLVAKDVVNCQKLLLPILQDLYFAQDDLEEHESGVQLLKDLGGVSSHAVNCTGNFMAGNMVGGTKELLNVAGGTIDVLLDRDSQSKAMQKTIRLIKDDYINYLSEYAKVYHAHMNEWNKLCLLRDRAYLDIQNGRARSAIQHLDDALEVSPNDKEARLLRALCLLQMGPMPVPLTLGDSVRPAIPANYEEANAIIEQYLKESPNRSAPALLLKGVYLSKTGELDEAFSYFDQASIEYPKQSEYLLDMFNAYQQRAYLVKSVESRYVLELYKSSMEGFGFFSPNFHKAMIHQKNGDMAQTQEEIRRHFFRRGGQVVSDFLISDLQFCSNYLNSSFNSMFIEKSFIDIEIQPTGMLGPKNSLNVKVNNRSDRTIENGRIFLCLHFTDMYVDDFAVFKVPTTVDKIGPRTEKEIDPPVTIEYTFDGKPKDLEKDIVQARAILVTDQFITWIDKEDFKIKAAQESMGHYSSSDVDVREGLEQILDRADLTQTEVFDLILKNTKIASDNGFFKDKMTIQLPRVLAFLNPVFSINPIDSESAVTPKDSQLFGSDIKLEFEMKEPVNGTFDLYMHSSYVTCKVTVSKANGSYKVSGVDFI